MVVVWWQRSEGAMVSFWSFCRIFKLTLRSHLTLVFVCQGHYSIYNSLGNIVASLGGLGSGVSHS